MNFKNLIRHILTVACIFLFTMVIHAENIVSYNPVNCSATSVSPSAINFPAGDDPQSEEIMVKTTNNCTNYAVTLLPSWLSYTKSGLTVILTAQANNGSARSANISIGGLTVAITQDAACKAASAAGSITGTSSVCQGQNSVSYSIPRILDATSYNWTYSSAGATITQTGNGNQVTINFASNAISGNLTAQGVSSCGLAGLVSPVFPVTVNTTPTKPTIYSNGPTTFCAGNSVTLTASTGSSYLWSDGETTQSINVTASGSYTVRVTNSSGCQSISSDPTVVTVNSKPTKPIITVPGSTTFCKGGVVELISSSGSSYLWSNGATSSFIEVTESGSYAVQVTNSNGCQSVVSNPVVVTVNSAPKPTIAANGPTTFCAGGNVVLTSSSATSYLWSNGATSKSISVSSSGSYTVQVIDANGCQSVASDPFVITVNALPSQPTITTNGPTTFCSYSDITLTSSPGASYLWSTGATTQSITVESGVNFTGNYSVKITDSNSCPSSNSNPVTVIINVVPSQPTITAGGSTSLCAGDNVILTSSPATSYVWSTGATTQSIAVNSAGNYTVKVSNSSGCQSISSNPVAITVNPLPSKPTIVSSGQPLCQGNTITLLGPVGMSSYLWSGPNQVSGSGSSLTITNADYEWSSGTYTLLVTNSNGCKNSGSQYFEVNVIPPVNASNNSPVCEGSTLNFTGSSGTTGFPAVTYSWSGPNNFLNNTQSPAITNASAGMTGNYTLKVTDNQGCTNSTSTSVYVSGKPTVTASNNGPVCEGNTINFTGPSGLTTYSWTGPNDYKSSSQNPSIPNTTADMSGVYTVTGTGSVPGCSNSASTTVTVNALTPIVLSDNKVVYEGSALTLAAPGGFTSYSWTDHGSFTSSSQNPTVSASATTTMSGTYSLTAVNNKGCTSQASTNITVRAFDKSLPVGSTAGGFAVSSTGAATYQIPIFVSPGTGGMTPGLSVTYNSQDGNGLLGLGWNLSGLSTICRLPKTLKDDGKVEAIQLSSGDPFGLDGNRLVVTNNGTYGLDGTQYHTQAETFVRVTSYGSSGTGPRWYKVETKDGRTIEYGNSETSYLQAANKDEIIFWYVSKITDANGNYVTYTYHMDRTKGELWPEKIDYTGNINTGLKPYNSIAFTYQARPDANTTYVAGAGIAHNVLLNAIQMVSDGAIVHEYNFNFPQNSSHLNEVLEYGTAHTKINATTINWPENAKNTEAFKTNFGSSTAYLFDDFNGDGKKEVFSWSNHHIYAVNDTRTGFSDLGSSVLYNVYADAKTGDFNGDGKSDVVVPLDDETKSTAFSFYKWNGNGFSLIGEYGIASSTHNSAKLYPADINGDGLTDLISRNPDDGTLTIFWGDPVSPFLSSTSITTIVWGEKQYFADFNGDGKIEVMTLDPSGYKIYEYKNSAFQLIQSNNQPTSKFDLYVGDFNGDGQSDFIYKFLGNNFKINISTGVNFVVTSQTLAGTFYNTWVGDMNGDGRDEFVTDMSAYAWKNNSLLVCGNNNVPEIPSTLYIQDFDGDGTMDCLWDNSNMYPEGLLYAQFNFNNNTRHQISSITNGLNNTLAVTYKPLNDNTVHTLLTDGAYQNIDIAPSWLAVASVKSDNGNGGQNQVDYHYTGAKYNNKDGQFLGFTKISQTDNTAGIISTSYYDIDKTYYFSKQSKSEVKTTTGTPLTEASFNTTVRDFGNNRLFVYQSQQTSIDHLHGDATATSSTVYNDDGNPTSSTSNVGGINTSTTTNTFITAGAWCPNKLLTSSTTNTRTGEKDYTSASSYSYYPNGLLKQQIAEPGNAKQVYTNYTYDDFGNVTQLKVSPDGVTGRVTNLQYEPVKGRMATQRSNVLGHYVNFTNNYALGLVTQTVDNNSLTTTYQYDNFGKLTQTTNPDGTTNNTAINWVTNNTPQNAVFYSTSQATGVPNVTQYFDRLGRPLRAETTGFDGRKLITETGYTSKGQVDYVTLPYYDGDAHTDRKSYTYDALGRIVTETAPGLSLTYTYNGLSTTITNNLNGRSTTKVADVSGALVQSSDAGGTISYTYNAMGQVRQVTSPSGTNAMGYDQFGRQTYLKDPNTGGIRYTYNVYGELLSQTDTLNNSTSLAYDNIGRVYNRTENSITTTWNYNTNGRLDNESASTGIAYTYTYDTKGRPSNIKETETAVFKTDFNTSYEYNSNGQVSKVTYPSGFAVTYTYKNGSLEEIKRFDNGASIWKLNTVNARGQVTQNTFGNNMVTTKTYDSRGYLQTILTTNGSNTVQNLAYSFATTGYLEWRKDVKRTSLTESFGYDNLGRLNAITTNGAAKSITYQANGNISNKSDAGTYAYSASHPNAVETLSDNKGVVSSQKQDITYTSFSMPATLAENGNTAGFTYGPEHERKIMTSNANGGITKYYSGSYERQLVGGITRELHYIAANGEIVAIFEKKSDGTTNMYYVHTDHLGSLNVITDANGAIAQETSYDAWGNRRDPATLQNYDTAPTGLITDRGFTGHEHLEVFKLINMNGRIYDPALGRFLSPDPFIANASSTQDYNRYSYCGNSPLMFTDPSGYLRMTQVDVSAINEGLLIGWKKFARGGGGDAGGSLFPSMCKDGIYSLADYDAQQKLNFDVAAGNYDEYAGTTVTVTTTNYMDYYNKNDGSYSGTRLVGISVSKMYVPHFWERTMDNTKRGMPVGVSNGRYKEGNWKEDKVGSKLTGIAAGLLVWYLSSGWGLTAKGEALIAAGSEALCLTSLKMESKRNSYEYDVTLWYGTYTYNIFTGDILSVNKTKIETTTINNVDLGILEERIIYSPTNTVILTKSTPIGKGSIIVPGPAPAVGLNLHGW